MAPRSCCNDRFEIKLALTSGGSGLVYLGKDVGTGERVFIKETDTDSHKYEKHLSDLTNERKALLKLNGYGAPRLVDSCSAPKVVQNEVRDDIFLIMEFIPNECSLEENPEFQNLTEVECAEIFYQLFSCLAKAHSNGFNHGDLEYNHIYWQKKYSRLIVIDWGNSHHNLKHDSEEIAFDLFKAGKIIERILAGNSGTRPTPPDLFNRLVELANKKSNALDYRKAGIDSRKLTDAAHAWLENIYISSNDIISTWISGWILNPEGGDWEKGLHLTKKVLPNFVLGQIADSALDSASLRRVACSKEEAYIIACENSNWAEARDIVNELHYQKLIPSDIGLVLSKIFFILSSEDRSGELDDDVLVAIGSALGQILDDRAREHGGDGKGTAFVEIAARRVFSPQSFFEQCEFLSRDSVQSQVFRLLEIIKYVEIDIDNHEKIMKWFRDNNSYGAKKLNSTYLSYKELDGLLLKLRNQVSLVDYDNDKTAVLFRINSIVNNLRVAIEALGNAENPKAASSLLSVWLQDRECFVAFHEWNRVVQHIQTAYPMRLFRQQPLEMQDALRSSQAKLVEVMANDDYPNEEKAVLAQKVLGDLPALLPVGWQLHQPVIEFLSLIEAYICTLKVGCQPAWLTQTNNTAYSLSQATWLRRRLSELLNKESSPRGESLQPKLFTKGIPDETSIQNDNQRKPQTIENTKQIDKVQIAPEKNDADEKINNSKTKARWFNRRMSIPVWVPVLGLVGILVVSFIVNPSFHQSYQLPSSSADMTSTAHTEHLSSQPVETLTPVSIETVLPTKTLEATETSLPTLAVTPVAFTHISKLLQFDNMNGDLPYQPFSVLILPPIANLTTPFPLQGKFSAGLFYDQNISHWRVKTFSTEVVTQYPYLNPLDINLGTLFSGQKLSSARALSLIGDSITLTGNGAIGIYYIDNSNQRYDFVLKQANGSSIIEIYKNSQFQVNLPVSNSVDFLETAKRYWFYLQFQDGQAQFFYTVDTVEKFAALELSALPYIYSVPIEGDLVELGLVAYNDADLNISQLILFGD